MFSAFSFPVLLNAKTVLNNGIFVKSQGPKVYFLENGMKRWVESPEVFNAFGFNWNKIRFVSEEELKKYPTGSDIKNAARYPDGILLRKMGGYKVYLVERGYRRWIKNATTFKNMGLFWDDVFELPEEKIEKIRERGVLEKYSKIKRPKTVLLRVPNKNVFETPETVTFKFSAITGTLFGGELEFETFLQGYDKRWIRNTRGERKIRLPKKGGNYIFYVRAKYKNGGADLTPEIFEFRIDISPIFEDIVFSSVNVRSDDPEKEFISLKNRTNIIYYLSGWSIESKKMGTKYYIPKARLVPNYLGYDYEIGLRLEPKGKVSIYSSKSPLGYSFRLNSCSGYLNNYFDFNPKLPRYCPRLDESEIEHLSNYCKNTIRKTNSMCIEPNYNDIYLNNECRNFMRDKLNYQNCVDENIQYYDFYKNEWRLYLQKTAGIWENENDTLILRDQDNFVVDTYKY